MPAPRAETEGLTPASQRTKRAQSHTTRRFSQRFPFRLGAEADALYRRVNFNFIDERVPDRCFSTKTTASSWEFPLPLKYPIGVGAEGRAGIFRIAPEFRYTRWGWENFRVPGNLLHTNQNQVDFLLGIRF